MAITFERVAAPGATPITNNGSSEKAFINNYYKLGEPNISMRETKAIIIDAMVYILAATGANYKANHKGLRQDAEVYTGGISNLNPWIALAAVSVGAANTTDSTFPLTLTGIENDIRAFREMHELQLDRIIAFLAAQLGI